jgi:hypothetical protein
MDTLESILRFAGSYPMWARILVLACTLVIGATLLLVPRAATTQTTKPVVNATEPAKKDQQVFIRVKPIKLFPERPDAEVQLSIFVNGTEYKHPSVGRVEWMKVGPSMSEKIIEVPTASRYDVRFEMRLRDLRETGEARLKTQQHLSQQVTPIKALPYTEEYRLYQVNNQSRSAGVSAVLISKLTPVPEGR